MKGLHEIERIGRKSFFLNREAVNQRDLSDKKKIKMHSAHYAFCAVAVEGTSCTQFD